MSIFNLNGPNNTPNMNEVGGGGIFVSTEVTGTGNSQTIAHHLGVIPTRVVVSVTELPDAAAETGFDIAEGAHTDEDIVLTVTNTVKFKVIAWT
jgi:hypothetical protein